MTKYIESVLQQLPKDNEGYKYIASETIYIPVQKTKLTITTRQLQEVRFVDEMILKFIDAGVTSTQDLAGYMGISSGILDISLAALFSQDYITATSRVCSITDKGRNFLEGEKSSKKEIEEMTAIYVNLCTGDIAFSDETYVGNFHANAYKCNHTLSGDVQFFRQNISKIKEGYSSRQRETQRRIVGDRKLAEESVSELLSINSAETTAVLFKKVKLNFYSSDSNNSVDITAADSLNADLVDKLKPHLQSEIKIQRLMRSTISTYNDWKLPAEPPPDSQSSSSLLNTLKKYYTVKDKRKFADEVSKHVFKNRSLIENELLPLVEVIAATSKKAEIYVGGDFSRKYQSTDISSTIEYIAGIRNVKIFFNSEEYIKRAKSTIINSHPLITEEHFIRKDFDDDIRFVFDNLYEICGTSYQMPVYVDMFLRYRKYELIVKA